MQCITFSYKFIISLSTRFIHLLDYINIHFCSNKNAVQLKLQHADSIYVSNLMPVSILSLDLQVIMRFISLL